MPASKYAFNGDGQAWGIGGYSLTGLRASGYNAFGPMACGRHAAADYASDTDDDCMIPVGATSVATGLIGRACRD